MTARRQSLQLPPFKHRQRRTGPRQRFRPRRWGGALAILLLVSLAVWGGWTLIERWIESARYKDALTRLEALRGNVETPTLEDGYTTHRVVIAPNSYIPSPGTSDFEFMADALSRNGTVAVFLMNPGRAGWIEFRPAEAGERKSPLFIHDADIPVEGVPPFFCRVIYDIQADLLDGKTSGLKSNRRPRKALQSSGPHRFLAWDEAFFDTPEAALSGWGTPGAKIGGLAAVGAQGDLSGIGIEGRRAHRLFPHLAAYVGTFALVPVPREDADPPGAPESLAHELYEALRLGHTYLAFDWMLPSNEVVFMADAPALRSEEHPGAAVMGDSLPYHRGVRLQGEVPAPCRLRILRGDKEVAKQDDARFITYDVNGPGVYRMEAWIEITGSLRPWILTNPIAIWDN